LIAPLLKEIAVTPLIRWVMLAVLVGGFLLTGNSVRAASDIKDEAGFFSADALKKAQAKLDEMDRKHQRHLMIRTFKAPPTGDARAESKDQDVRNQFFRGWADELANKANLNGVIILISRNPGHVEVRVGDATTSKLFTSADSKELAEELIRRFKNKEYDTGLVEAVNYVEGKYDQRDRAPARSTTHAPAVAHGNPGGGFNLGGLICIGLVIVAGIWILFSVIRAITGAGRGPRGYAGGPGMGYGGGYGGGGGGGFMSSLFGGLFGAAAGNWMYDRFFRGDYGHTGAWGNSGAGGDYSAGGNTGLPDDQDYSAGAGGDFDSSGDAGGGGGDFGGGGGDFGGGGGDFGGGGGDFGGGGGGDFGGGGGGDFGGGGGDF
jgi:uncharacterized protein